MYLRCSILRRTQSPAKFAYLIYFRKNTTPQLLEHIRLQSMKVGGKTNFGRLATIFQICSMDANIVSYMSSKQVYIQLVSKINFKFRLTTMSTERIDIK